MADPSRLPTVVANPFFRIVPQCGTSGNEQKAVGRDVDRRRKPVYNNGPATHDRSGPIASNVRNQG